MIKKRSKRPSHSGPKSQKHETLLEAALAYQSAGLSIIPIRADGSKGPATWLLPGGGWKAYQNRLAREEEVCYWFDVAKSGTCGLAVVCGLVSGGLEVIDIDDAAFIGPFRAALEERSPGLFRRLVRVKTPRPGLHVMFRSNFVERAQKLAYVPTLCLPQTESKRVVQAGGRVIVETRGTGSYIVAPPSPASCHESGRRYRLSSRRDLTDVPHVTWEEREALFAAARSLGTWNPAPRPTPVSRPARYCRAGGRPGDDFNRRGSWSDLLIRHGWQYVRTGTNGSVRWRRPGKRAGSNATSDYGRHCLFFNFSSNGFPFETDRGYTKFTALALLEHQGDHAAAARRLAREGYGDPNYGRRWRSPKSRSVYSRCVNRHP